MLHLQTFVKLKSGEYAKNVESVIASLEAVNLIWCSYDNIWGYCTKFSLHSMADLEDTSDWALNSVPFILSFLYRVNTHFVYID